MSFGGLLVVLVVAVAAPLIVGLVPAIRVPAVVLEILLGVLLGPSVLGWVEIDAPIEVVSVIGLAFLLFLAGMEIDLERLRGPTLRLAALGLAASAAVALVVGLGLDAAGLGNGLFLAIVLLATSLGLVVPVLKDARHTDSSTGQLVIAGATVADFSAVILLSLLFSGESTGVSTKLVLLGAFVAAAGVVAAGLAWSGRSMRLNAVFERLEDTTAQIRVRAAVAIMVGFAALAGELGLETILGAFVAGALLRVVDKEELARHPRFAEKLEGIGYGFVIPVYFVTSGLRFDADALFASPSTVARVPLFLLALLAVRGLPAVLYRPALADQRAVVAAGLLQATSLPFIVASTQIGLEMGLVNEANTAALVGAGLLSVILFPPVAVGLLRDSGHRGPTAAPAYSR
ncbi:MAG TPA: cation:proton antiporter [Acidimicrobiales bacterium]|jgi:Kef-type K+ transport system membrane component KefB|nr:cation:proton antiporter [Acidimicrobiales bacterium]